MDELSQKELTMPTTEVKPAQTSQAAYQSSGKSGGLALGGLGALAGPWGAAGEMLLSALPTIMSSVNGYGEREAARKANQYAQDQMILSNQLTTDLQNKAAQHQKDYFNHTAAYNTPEQQVKRLKQAGLNPALAYAGATGAGGTGQTGSAPSGQTGVGGVTKANIAGSQAASTQQAIATATMMADIELKKSQARKNTVEADYTEGVKTEETAANVNLMVDQLKTAGLGREGMKIQQARDRISYELESATFETNKQRIFEDYEQMVAKTGVMYEELASARRSNRIGDETEKIVVEQARANLNETWAEITLKKANAEATRLGMTLTQQQVDNLKTEGQILLQQNNYWRTTHVVQPGMRLEIMRDAEQRAQAERMDRALTGLISGILHAGAGAAAGGAKGAGGSSAGTGQARASRGISPDRDYWEEGLGK